MVEETMDAELELAEEISSDVEVVRCWSNCESRSRRPRATIAGGPVPWGWIRTAASNVHDTSTTLTRRRAVVSGAPSLSSRDRREDHAKEQFGAVSSLV